jgi:hypothetical protein
MDVTGQSWCLKGKSPGEVIIHAKVRLVLPQRPPEQDFIFSQTQRLALQIRIYGTTLATLAWNIGGFGPMQIFISPRYQRGVGNFR